MNLHRLDPARGTGGQTDRLIKAFSSEAGEIRAADGLAKPRMVLYLLSGMAVCFVVIASFFDIDRVVESQEGQVMTVDPPIVLQALDVSIIRSVDVEEGQIVKPGQLLETLDPTFAAADEKALRDQIAALDAQIERDEAEIGGRSPRFSPSGEALAKRYQALQQAYFDQRKSAYAAQLVAYDEQIAQSRATIDKFNQDLARLADRGVIADRIEKMWVGLQALDSGSLLQTLSAKDSKLQLDKDIEFEKNSIPETEHALASTIATRDAFIHGWFSQTSQDLLAAGAARDAALDQLAKASRHTDLVRVEAPDDCITLKVPKLSVGSVLKTGDLIMKLALIHAPIEVELEISPRDVGFVRPGDDVTLKLDAYEFVEHGTVSGKVRWISEGTFTTDLISGDSTDSNGASIPPYFKVRVQLGDVKLTNVPRNFHLLPGMTLTADVHVGKRSLLLYLVKGIVRTTTEAMREPE